MGHLLGYSSVHRLFSFVSAAYLAAADGGVVTMPHLLHGARRELQKMGRLLKEKDLD